jgi:N-carbamoylputrescine amidase
MTGAPPRTLGVAAVQLEVSDEREANLRNAGEQIDAAVAAGARLILLPEIFSAPFVASEPDGDYFRHAEPLDGPSNAMVAERSRRHGVTIVSPIFERSEVPGVFYNSACTFSAGELVGHYRKSHLPFSNGFPEKFYFRPGGAPPAAVRAEGAGVGCIICYERHFPEMGRLAALAGAEVLCIPVACASAPTKTVFELELRAQAAFNAVFVLCANRVGTEGDKRYYGMSGVYAPDGEILARAEREEQAIVTAEIDLGAVAARRARLPLLRDRRPDLYGAIAREDSP